MACTDEIRAAIKLVETAGYRVLKPKRIRVPERTTAEVLAAIGTGTSYRRIAKNIGLTPGQVAGIYYRRKRANSEDKANG